MRAINAFLFVHWLYLLWHLKNNNNKPVVINIKCCDQFCLKTLFNQLKIKPCLSSFAYINEDNINYIFYYRNIQTIGCLKNQKAFDWFCLVTWQIEKDFAPGLQVRNVSFFYNFWRIKFNQS